MSEEERNAIEEGNFEVDELDESRLEDVAGGNDISPVTPTNGSGCNGSQCSC